MIMSRVGNKFALIELVNTQVIRYSIASTIPSHGSPHAATSSKIAPLYGWSNVLTVAPFVSVS